MLSSTFDSTKIVVETRNLKADRQRRKVRSKIHWSAQSPVHMGEYSDDAKGIFSGIHVFDKRCKGREGVTLKCIIAFSTATDMVIGLVMKEVVLHIIDQVNCGIQFIIIIRRFENISNCINMLSMENMKFTSPIMM